MKRLRSRAHQSGLSRSSDAYIPQKTLDGVYSLVVRILLDITLSAKNGTAHRYQALGMTQEQILHTSQLSSDVMDELAHGYARTVACRAAQGGAISVNYFEIGELVYRRQEDEGLALRFLKAEASNELMYKLFGKRSTECTILRREHNIQAKKGRKCDPKNVDEAQMQIHRLFQSVMKEARCSRFALLIIHERTGFPINYVHRVVTDNDQFPL